MQENNSIQSPTPPVVAPQVAVEQPKQSNFLVILLSVLLFMSVAIAGFFAFQTQKLVKELTDLKNQSSPEATVKPTVELSVSDIEPAIETGIVTGKLCYPSEMLPPGEIIAKDVVTNKLYNQKYVGSGNGGASSYVFELPVGTYRLKYMASLGNGIYASLYNTNCAMNNIYDLCIKNENHEIIQTVVKPTIETKNIDLCDMGISKEQQEFLNSSF